MKTIGNYQFIQYLEDANYSAVWKCRRITTGEFVACRIVSKDNLRLPGFFDHFKNELIIHSQMSHPGITKLLDIATEEDNIYLFFEHFEGGNLNDLVLSNGGLDEETAKHYFGELMSAIAYIHSRKIAHRDIKLENILLSEDDNIKLSDFGLCKQQKAGNLLLTTCGTLVYAAPEIIKEEPYDGMKADIWSAGIVLFAMIENGFPWCINEDLPPERLSQETARQIINGEVDIPEEISFELANLLTNMLNTDPDDRPSAEDILQHPWLDMEPLNFDDNIQPDKVIMDLAKSLINELKASMNEKR